MNKLKVLEIYKDIIIGDNYKDEKLFVKDIDTKEKLLHIMYDFFSREVDLNREGIKFLQDYWGLEEVANIIFEHEREKGDFTNEFENKNGLVIWLKKML